MPTAADILIESLLDWGVGVVFGLPGDGINGIMEALRERQDEIRFVQVRHEESAAFMATAYAKYTGKLGVCLGTSGPGAIHLLSGLYDALFSDVALYNQRVMGPTHVAMLADIACRTALARRAVAHISFPVDLQEQEHKRKVISNLEQAQRGMQEWWRLMDVRAARDDLPLKPQVVAKALSELAAPNAIISTDSGTITAWIARHFVMKRGQMFSLSGNLATMASLTPSPRRWPTPIASRSPSSAMAVSPC